MLKKETMASTDKPIELSGKTTADTLHNKLL
jgi:hypothetical protein